MLTRSMRVPEEVTGSMRLLTRLTPQVRLWLGLGLIGVSLTGRAVVAILALLYFRSAGTLALAGVLYIFCKVLFYAGLAVAGPSAVQRWREKRRAAIARR